MQTVSEPLPERAASRKIGTMATLKAHKGLAPEVVPLAELLDTYVREGELYVRLEKGKVRCVACGHRCVIPDGFRGICKVRFNRGGKLFVPWGYVAALQADPVEKKPFYHLLPGSTALTFGMLGCDFHCSYCQNWVTSQALRDPRAGSPIYALTPEDFWRLVEQTGARVIASSYNEPLITSEWARALFEPARGRPVATAYVSNGNATPEVLDYLRPFLLAYKVDLKTMNPRNYRKLGGVLDHVLWTIENAHRRGFWVEVVTLVVPGFNDSEEEIREAARFLKSVSADIPWHLTAFYPQYKMQDRPPTSVQFLRRAGEIAREEGLRFVYVGNVPGMFPELEHTHCPHCHAAVVRRRGFAVLENRITGEGTCPDCGTRIPGIWTEKEVERWWQQRFSF